MELKLTCEVLFCSGAVVLRHRLRRGPREVLQQDFAVPVARDLTPAQALECVRQLQGWVIDRFRAEADYAAGHARRQLGEEQG